LPPKQASFDGAFAEGFPQNFVIGRRPVGIDDSTCHFRPFVTGGLDQARERVVFLGQAGVQSAIAPKDEPD
jgi:hypothetical protein